ncbi:MAG: DNA polymerase III subunit gamma/tau [Ilumatobacteraceae bacterium]|jgi:DNA polymerase-3 subunit gamma/tau|nr:DNA polymerase III subunit gamma/tau [Ilumatobacteraceae bacterium]
MAAQSLYRRYRPQRFSELKGQEHIVRALKNSIVNSREGHAYLFSGPRGTGKTTTARILAKVLNCDSPVDGEPCCACPSCLAVQTGNSFDVIELDAASNNGVADIREIIASASLGSPGRHRVFILDEVHMLSKSAEAALLKTLEEPPPGVVFVLATTDPQKVGETIRSRTQHLQFHLLQESELEEHVRWVVADAGLDVSPETIEAVVRQGAGSVRDTLSALELAVAVGGIAEEATPVDEFVEALVAYDAGRLLAAVAQSVSLGREPRSIVDDLVAHLRDCFLSQMAPELVQLSERRSAEVSDQAQRLGTPRVVKIIETLGQTINDMKGAPDPRVVLEVSLVKLVHRELQMGVEALMARIERLEREIENRPVIAPAPVNPSTGRAVLGGRVKDPSTPTPRAETPAPVPEPTTSVAPPPAASTDAPVTATTMSAADVVTNWSTAVINEMKGMRRAVAQMAKPAHRDGTIVLVVDNEHAAKRVKEYLTDITDVVHRAGAGKCPVIIETRPDDSKPIAKKRVVEDETIDIDEIKNLPTVSEKDVTDSLAEMFPGSVIETVEE